MENKTQKQTANFTAYKQVLISDRIGHHSGEQGSRPPIMNQSGGEEIKTWKETKSNCEVMASFFTSLKN